MLGDELVEQLAPRGSSTSEVGPLGDELRQGGRERGVARHRHSPGAVAAEEAPGPVDQARLGQLPEVARVARVPEREERHVRLAVIADLEAQLGRRRRAALLELTRAGRAPGRRGGRPRDVRSACAAGESNGSSSFASPAGVAPASSGGGSPASVRIRNAPGALVGDDGHGRSPALGLVEPGNDLGRRRRGPGSARAAPRRACPPAGPAGRASACGASRTSASATA